MTPRLSITILTLAVLVATPFYTRGQAINKKSADKNLLTQNTLKLDTSRTAIINDRWPFDSTYKAAILTQDELQIVDSFLFVCVTNHNNLLDNEHKNLSIDLKKRNYRKQLIVVTNIEGQKEVWVNCFCEILDDRWKTKAVFVLDGGNCYFNFKINLSTKVYYDLIINSWG